MPTNLPPFVILTHRKPHLNEAVQLLCFKKGLHWMGNSKEPEAPGAGCISNTFHGDTMAHLTLKRGAASFDNFHPSVHRFDAETDLAKFAEFLHSPPEPEPKVRPWTRDEVPLGKEAKHKVSGTRGLLTSVSDATNSICIGGVGFYTPNELLESWTLADGSPCGVIEEEA